MFAAIGECMLELRRDAAGGHHLGFGGDTLNTAVYVARYGAEAGIAVDYVTGGVLHAQAGDAAAGNGHAVLTTTGPIGRPAWLHQSIPQRSGAPK